MNWRNIVLACIGLTCIVVLSCQKLEQTPPSGAALKFEQMKFLDAIPSDFGNLVAVTVDPAYSNWAQLWFEKPDKTIMVVRVQWRDGYLSDRATIIPRR